MSWQEKAGQDCLLHPRLIQTKGVAAKAALTCRQSLHLLPFRCPAHSLESTALKTWAISKTRLRCKPCLGFVMSSILLRGFGMKAGMWESGFTRGTCDYECNKE